ncbi:MAG TPA: hypothetical protein VFE16_02435 [Candidatus Cybelea sp.]|jgi:hypothetical protein|nr:hypothetical protein [Candidatus Cybelea sp.]
MLVRRFLNIHDWAITPHRAWAAAYLRVALGAFMTLFFLDHLTQVLFLWGPHGQVGPITSGVWASNRGTFTLYIAALLVSLALAIGILPRLTIILFNVVLLLFWSRNAPLLDGGHDILAIIAFYLCFADTTSYYCLFRAPLLDRFKVIRRLSVVVHNAAMTMILIQISLVYFWSSAFKIMGHMWQDGTALYYILRSEWFSSPVASHIYLNATFVTLATYGTIVVEMSFAFLLWSRKARIPVLCCIIGLHLGIGVMMGLKDFAIIMIAIDIGVLSDADILRIERLVTKLTRRTPSRQAAGLQPAVSGSVTEAYE